jgi:hypothetical protein
VCVCGAVLYPPWQTRCDCFRHCKMALKMAKPVLIVQVFPPLHDGREWWPVFLGGKKTKMLLWLGIVVCCVRVLLAIKTGRVMRDAPRTGRDNRHIPARIQRFTTNQKFWLTLKGFLLLYIVALKGLVYFFFFLEKMSRLSYIKKTTTSAAPFLCYVG